MMQKINANRVSIRFSFDRDSVQGNPWFSTLGFSLDIVWPGRCLRRTNHDVKAAGAPVGRIVPVRPFPWTFFD